MSDGKAANEISRVGKGGRGGGGPTLRVQGAGGMGRTEPITHGGEQGSQGSDRAGKGEVWGGPAGRALSDRPLRASEEPPRPDCRLPPLAVVPYFSLVMRNNPVAVCRPRSTHLRAPSRTRHQLHHGARILALLEMQCVHATCPESTLLKCRDSPHRVNMPSEFEDDFRGWFCVWLDATLMLALPRGAESQIQPCIHARHNQPLVWCTEGPGQPCRSRTVSHVHSPSVGAGGECAAELSAAAAAACGCCRLSRPGCSCGGTSAAADPHLALQDAGCACVPQPVAAECWL